VSSTIEAVLSMWSVWRLYNDVYRITQRLKLGGGQAYDRSSD
jgi:hypothetical protein